MAFKTLQNFEEIYVTADLHLSNKVNRTIAYRGFKTGEEHTKFIRNLINSTIRNKNAVLYIVGDLGFKQEDEELIHFIKSLTPVVKVALGNHDSSKQLKRLWAMGIIADFKHDYKIRWNNYLFHLNHLPLLEWIGYFEDGFCVHGHTHGNLKELPNRSVDCGLDCNNMKILNLYDIINMRKMYHNVDENKNRIQFY